MANTKISALTALTSPTGSEEFVYAYNNTNWKITLDTMKSFVGWTGITTLNADANIWELSEWFYETTYDLYYITGEKIPHIGSTWATWKQMLFVTEESTGQKGFFVFNVWHTSIVDWLARAAYWYSVSSSEWEINILWDRNWALKQFGAYMAWGWNPWTADSLGDSNISQLVYDAEGTTTLTVSWTLWRWVPYTIIFNSIASGETYTVALGTGVTNPLWITLPSGSTKKSVITLMPTSTSAAIVTGCTIEA